MEQKLPDRVDDMSCLFAEFGQLARKFEAVDLAIGTPEIDPPKFLKDALHDAVDSGPHQYTEPRGWRPLRVALAKHYSPYYAAIGRDLDPDTEILPVAGAVAGIHCALQSLVCPGDEVVTFEPFWPGFVNLTKAAGGVLKGVPLKKSVDKESKTMSWAYDFDALEAALSETTKVMVLINPQSPSGLVFDESDLEKLTDILDRKAPQAYVLCDNVYDFCKFDESKEFSNFANYKNNFERTITCNNGGKRFACTGWKVGWVVGPKDLIHRIALFHETAVWNFNCLGQIAFSKCIAGEADKPFEGFDSYCKWQNDLYQKVNLGLAKVFQESKLPVYPSIVDGGFAMTLEISDTKDMIPEKYFSEDYIDDGTILKRTFDNGFVPLDVAFCRWMACEVGVAFIPGSSLFVSLKNATYDFVRISICKKEDIVERVREKLKVLE